MTCGILAPPAAQGGHVVGGRAHHAQVGRVGGIGKPDVGAFRHALDFQRQDAEFAAARRARRPAPCPDPRRTAASGWPAASPAVFHSPAPARTPPAADRNNHHTIHPPATWRRSSSSWNERVMCIEHRGWNSVPLEPGTSKNSTSLAQSSRPSRKRSKRSLRHRIVRRKVAKQSTIRRWVATCSRSW